MKKSLLLTLAILLAVSASNAQVGGSFGIFADPAGANCEIADTSAALCNVYIVHVNASAVSAAEFGVSAPTCILAPFLSYTPLFAVDIGFNPAAPLEGRSVGYGGCATSPVHVATLGYFCQGLTTPCCYQAIIPHAGNGQIGTVDCSSNLLSAAGGEAIWSAQSGCNCDVVNRASTWGAVKEMFHEN